MKMRIVLMAGILLGNLLIARAQTSRGTITGIVTDSSGAVIAGASVSAVNDKTGVSRNTTSNGDGLYRFDAVDPGTYTVKIVAGGFGNITKTNVVVDANQIAQVDVQMNPSAVETTIDISAEAGALLQTEAPVRGGTIDETKITELPVASRNPVSLALTLPGVSSNRYGFGVATFSVNGSRGRSNNFLIDGTENNDISVAGQAFQITNPDAIQEVSVQTSNYDAEFGRAGGAVVNTITKSGTNQYHGTLSYLIESTRFDAITNTEGLNPAVQKRGHPLPGTDQWFSGTIGGPIIKGRTFFFGAYQEERQNSTGSANVTSLSPAGRSMLRSLFPAGTNKNVDLYLNVTNGTDAVTQLFPIALGKNNAGPSIEFGTAILSVPAKVRDRQWQSRIDHKLGENDQLSGRFLFDDFAAPTGGAAPTFIGFFTSDDNRYQNFGVSETHIFSPRWTNELRTAYNRIAISFPNDATSALAKTLPVYSIPQVTQIGLQTNLPQGRIANNYLLQDAATHVHGDHTIRFGAELLDQRSRQFAPIVDRGLLTYGAGGGYTGFANFVGDFGGSGGGTRRDFGSPAYYPSLFRQAYFGQDRWRVSQALTLTLGVRWEYFGLPVNSLKTPAFTGLFNIDPNTLTGPFNKPNKVQPDYHNFAPTIGLAYSPAFTKGVLGRIFGDRHSVIRSGYQIGYDSFFNNIASNAQTSAPNLVATLTPSIISASTPRGLPNVAASLPTTGRAVLPKDTQNLVIANLINPYYQRWSLGIERELPGNWLIDVSYVGSKGTKLFINEDLNPVVPPSLQIIPHRDTPYPPGVLQPRVDALQGARLIRTNGGGSNYNAAELNVTHRFSHGLQATAAYTYSKSIDNSSEVFGIAQNNSPQQTAIPSRFGGLKFDRSVSLFDRTQRASFTLVYDLPIFTDQRGFLGRVAGGWEVSTVTTFETGVPLNVFNGVDADGIGGNFDRPQFNPLGQAGVRAVPSASSPTGYVNPDDPRGPNTPIDPKNAMYIGIAANSGHTGNLGRFTLRTPGINNWDANIQKTFRITEGTRLQFRTEFYNAFNHSQLGSPSISPFSPGQQGVSADVFNSPPGRFLNPTFADGGGRVVRFLLKFVF